MLKASFEFAEQRVVSLKVFQKWAGLMVPILMHRRECMSALHTIYKWAAKIPESGVVPIPNAIRDEIFSVGLMSVLAFGNVRWQVEPR